jgi:hypothetical protein
MEWLRPVWEEDKELQAFLNDYSEFKRTRIQ